MIFRPTYLKGKKESASELMPRVHRIASVLKRWVLGTHQGAVSHEHAEYYLDEFTFRFNRRRSANRGKLFYRLAAAIDPVPYKSMVSVLLLKWSPTTTGTGYLSDVHTQLVRLLPLIETVSVSTVFAWLD